MKDKKQTIAIFKNIYAYPSLSGKLVTITSEPNNDFPYYGVSFVDGSIPGEMAARDYELLFIN